MIKVFVFLVALFVFHWSSSPPFTSIVTSSSHQLFTSVVTPSSHQLFTSVVTPSSRRSFHFYCHLLFPSIFSLLLSPPLSVSFSLLLSLLLPVNLFTSVVTSSPLQSFLPVPCWSHQWAVRQLRHRPSSASQELGTRQDTDHLQHHKNWKLDKTHIY